MTTPTPPIIQSLLGPQGIQVGCDECFDLLDSYVDAEVAGIESDLVVPGMRTHLDGCPACNDEYESLRALVTQR